MSEGSNGRDRDGRRAADGYPRFHQLPIRAGAPAGSSWGVFGDDDEVGTLNFITAEKVRRAASLVRRGRIFNLDLPLHLPDPPAFAREPYRHTHLSMADGIIRDDVIDRFYPQGSSQWDGLSHYAHRRHGFYNGVGFAEVSGEEGSRLGIEHWAVRGIVSRGVVVDVARHLEAQGRPISAREERAILASTLEETLRAQEVELEPGDILLLRTGWLAQYLAASSEERRDFRPERGSPGLAAEEAVAAFLWDHRVAGIAADNVTLEVQPSRAESGGSLHRRLIPLLGMAVGELWNLEELARDSQETGDFSCLLVSSPLHLRGAAGSTANALALR